ncbi:MAG TPA: tetratricopeptide repeat protein [Thermoanaerobaculia bacterium]|nr:tetratricopeptide repeat protein [Thermoanaerobaculia bacterium]
MRSLGSFATAGRKEEDKPTPTARPSRLPGRPPRCFGREDEVRELVETLLQPSPPPTPILGPPGVGKTTLTLEALHEPRVKARYRDRRFFIRCDGTKSRDAVVAEISLGVGLESGPDLEGRLFQNLESEPAVLALDNLETPWEADTSPVEELLTQLSTTPGVVLVASVRGDQRPFGPKWREAIRVGPLGLPAARDTFVDVAGARFRSDPDLDRLLEAVDRLPIAVVLMAHQAEGDSDLTRLWKQWQEKRTALLRRADGRERLTNFEVSLELSISGARMTPEAHRLLTVLALLPDGAARQDLDALLPGDGDEAASILRKVGLGFNQATRVRVLAPIREYVHRQHPAQEEDLSRVIEHYLNLAEQGEQVGADRGAEAAAKLVNELGNVDSMISLGLERTDPEPAVWAAVGFGEFVRFSGRGTQASLERAMHVAQTTEREWLQAACAKKLGDIALLRSDHDAARNRYEEALALYRRVGNVLGEANCIRSLGNIALQRSDHDAARDRYQEALPLYRRVGDVLGEANCIRSLGDIALLGSDHDAARDRYEEALPLYRRVGDVLGEATCIWRLGDIALRRSDHDAARDRYEEALPLYRRISSVLGEANCIQSLGDIALLRSDLDAARDRYQEALPLYRRVSSVLGEANCIQKLGDIALRRSDRETAGAKFAESLGLYKRVQARYSIGWAHVRLARLAPDGSEERQGHLRAAREAWESVNRQDQVEELREEFGEIP